MLLRSTLLLLSIISFACSKEQAEENVNTNETFSDSINNDSSLDAAKLKELSEARIFELSEILSQIGVKEDAIEQTVAQIINKAQFNEWDVVSKGKIFSAETLTRENIKIINLNFGPENSSDIGLKIIAITIPTYKVFVSLDYWEESAIKEANNILISNDKDVAVIGDYLVIESTQGSIKLKN